MISSDEILVSYPLGISSNEWINGWMNGWMNQSINRSINQSISLLIRYFFLFSDIDITLVYWLVDERALLLSVVETVDDKGQWLPEHSLVNIMHWTWEGLGPGGGLVLPWGICGLRNAQQLDMFINVNLKFVIVRFSVVFCSYFWFSGLWCEEQIFTPETSESITKMI